MTRVFVGLGSNLGDRAGNLRQAVFLLKDLTDTAVLRTSSVYETEPIGVTDQPDFLNAVAEIDTELAPIELLRALKGIEQGMGRSEDGPRWGAREIDLDVLLWAQDIIKLPELTVPHPEFRSRSFVLEPLRELLPDYIDPVTGRTLLDLARSPEACGATRNVGPLALA